MSDKYDALKLENQLCFPLYVASKEVVRRYKPLLDELNLTYTQYIALLVLWEQKKLSVKELGEFLFLDSGTLTPVLKSLEKKGYISRKKSKDDERVLIVELTDEGKELREKAVSVPSGIAECIDIDKKDAEKLLKILHNMLSGFKE